ncbi:hypothetical protein [uncultured Mycolicibacterium sp.]|uniref:aa3-type cytochrome oxidase subunit CtaJ n=1 Tax=uncultured Mycolicibacterium sp. TaxID=2320817 RepID=UPI003451E447
MSIAQYLLVMLVIPAAVTLVIGLVAMRGKKPRPVSYKLGEPWRHAPILWAAEEPADHGHGGHGDATLTIGGSASGKW